MFGLYPNTLLVFGLLLCICGCNAKLGKKYKDLNFGKGSATGPGSPASCDNIVCGAGRHCVTSGTAGSAAAVCECLPSCPTHDKPVCGSDAVSYTNHCELHRAACTLSKHISIQHDGHCRTDVQDEESDKLELSTPPTPPPRPVVCYQDERDKLRAVIIDWLEGMSLSRDQVGKKDKRGGHHAAAAGGKKKKSHWSYHSTVRRQFHSCDADRSRSLSSEELLACMERSDEDERERRTSGGGLGVARRLDILRGLCIDALIDLADQNQDWQLNMKEYRRLMNPHFIPPARNCSLEDKQYTDGAETKVDCNTCVCACGHWVCTATACESESEPGQQQQHLTTRDPASRHPHYTVKERSELEASLLDRSEWDELISKFKAFTAPSTGSAGHRGVNGGVRGRAAGKHRLHPNRRNGKLSRNHRNHHKHVKNHKKNKHHKDKHHKNKHLAHHTSHDKYIE